MTVSDQEGGPLTINFTSTTARSANFVTLNSDLFTFHTLDYLEVGSYTITVTLNDFQEVKSASSSFVLTITNFNLGAPTE
jgi:hypothetical protein